MAEERLFQTRKTAKDVITEVAAMHGLTFADMTSRRLTRKYAWARQEAMFEVYTRCPHFSLPRIGELLGGRDHTTIRHGIIAHGKRIGVDYADIRRDHPIALTGLSRAVYTPFSASQYREMVRL